MHSKKTLPHQESGGWSETAEVCRSTGFRDAHRELAAATDGGASWDGHRAVKLRIEPAKKGAEGKKEEGGNNTSPSEFVSYGALIIRGRSLQRTMAAHNGQPKRRAGQSKCDDSSCAVAC